MNIEQDPSIPLHFDTVTQCLSFDNERVMHNIYCIDGRCHPLPRQTSASAIRYCQRQTPHPDTLIIVGVMAFSPKHHMLMQGQNLIEVMSMHSSISTYLHCLQLGRDALLCCLVEPDHDL